MAIRMKSEERRAAIVEAAIHLFAEKGFRGTTTRGLAAALGVSGPVLYQHFKTKRDLYRAIIETKSQQGDRQTAGLAVLQEAGDDRAFFRYLGNRILERYEDDPDFMRLLLFSALEGHELADLFFERQVQGYFRLVSSHIQRRIEEGKFRPVDAQAAAYGFNGMVSHYGLTRLLFSNRVAQKSRAEMVDEMVEIFLGGVALADDVAPDSRPAR
jgi:AcrR family transcriptional regulator